MILTLTGNLLAERTLEFERWSPGRTQRAAAESFQVGGKGINVSRMLVRLDAPTSAWCFTGGAAGGECRDWLVRTGLPHRAFPSAAPTRTGLVIRSADTAETTFLAPDRPVDAAALDACACALEEALGPGAVLALCGSFPGWTAPEALPLQRAVERWIDAGRFVADTYGPPLAWAVQRPVALVKVNRDEFQALFPEAERGAPLEALLTRALELWPVRAWVITDGPEAVWLADAGTRPQCLHPPAVREVSPTGSGDVLLACLLHARENLKLGLAEAVKAALPYASANAAHPGVAEFDLNQLPTAGSLHP